MSRWGANWSRKLRGVLSKIENLGWGSKEAYRNAKVGVKLEEKVKGGVDFG